MNTLHSPVATQAHGHQKPLAWWFRGLLGASLLAGACATQAQGTPPSVGATPAAAEAAGVRNSDLDAPLFYQLLLGELNVGSGDPGTGYSYFLDAARKQHDAQLYRRAVDIALQARSGRLTLRIDRYSGPDGHRVEHWINRVLFTVVGVIGLVGSGLVLIAGGLAGNDTVANPLRLIGFVGLFLSAAMMMRVVAQILARRDDDDPF